MNYRLAYNPVLPVWILLRWEENKEDGLYYPDHPNSDLIVSDLKLEPNWSVMFVENNYEELWKVIFAQTNEPRKNRKTIIVPTPEEDIIINHGISQDPDAFTVDDEWFKNAQSSEEAVPHILERYRQVHNG